MTGLEGKIIVVAGGASGIGQATCERLARAGAHVVVGDLDGVGAEHVAATLRNEGHSARSHTFDIADDESCGALIASAVDAGGRLDGLFNVAADTSAATLGRDTDALSVPLEVWRRTLDVDLTGYLHTIRHALPHLLAVGGGAIVNTISGLVLNGDRTRAAYGAAKGGVVVLTRHVASRWGREGIRCNSIAPGFVATEQSLANVPADEQERLLAMVRSPRLGRPDDVAALASFLLSDDGEWINGQLIPVNGGTGLR
jgi:NAD(P)-dependent dehydrogenase (short-subunit alcohol dehydrogenase family)